MRDAMLFVVGVLTGVLAMLVIALATKIWKTDEEWTPIQKGKPKHSTIYLVTRVNTETGVRFVKMAYYDRDKDIWVDDHNNVLENVVAWRHRVMPMKKA